MVIYKTTNLINGKIYIGQDLYNNPNYLGSGIHLKRAIKRYGKKNFKKEIIEICISQNHLNEKEIYWIKFYNSRNKKIGYNLTGGGDGGDTLSNHPNLKNINKKKSSSMKGKNKGDKNGAKRKVVRNRISKSLEKLWGNKKYRENQTRSLIGRKLPKHSLQTRKRIKRSITKWWKKRK